MELKGRVKGGVIVLDSTDALPEGIEVRVITDALSHELPTLSERFGEICGKAAGLPPDLAERHDYYVSLEITNNKQ